MAVVADEDPSLLGLSWPRVGEICCHQQPRSAGPAGSGGSWRTTSTVCGRVDLALIVFSLYDLLVVSDEQIQKWADEAEAGYDVEELKRRGRGRPGRGAEPMQVVAVRLTAEEIAALDAVAEREHLSRSEAIRRALADFAA